MRPLAECPEKWPLERQLSRRASAFQEAYHPGITDPENTPAAQLTRIGAANRLFSVPLTRITSVPGCAASSLGFLWGSASVSRTCGVAVGVRRSPCWSSRADTRHRIPLLADVDDQLRRNLALRERPARPEVIPRRLGGFVSSVDGAAACMQIRGLGPPTAWPSADGRAVRVALPILTSCVARPIRPPPRGTLGGASGSGRVRF
jgi:hypothetical protein